MVTLSQVVVKARRSRRVWLPVDICRSQRRMPKASSIWYDVLTEGAPLLWCRARLSRKSRVCWGCWLAGVCYFYFRARSCGLALLDSHLPHVTDLFHWDPEHFLCVAFSSTGLAVTFGNDLEVGSIFVNSWNNLPFPESMLRWCSISLDILLLCTACIFRAHVSFTWDRAQWNGRLGILVLARVFSVQRQRVRAGWLLSSLGFAYLMWIFLFS